MKKTSNLFHQLPTGPKPPEEVFCIVEIPRGCTNKYEYNRKYKVFLLDRVLYESVFYPTEYGIIPRTWQPDEDPLDIMVLSTFPTFPGCVLVARPIGILKLLDSGKKDSKIIGVPRDDPRFDNFKELKDLTTHFKKEIWNFWENYAELQPDKKIIISGWGEKKEAYQIINEAIKAYKKAYK